jgi:hypothetical protein
VTRLWALQQVLAGGDVVVMTHNSTAWWPVRGFPVTARSRARCQGLTASAVLVGAGVGLLNTPITTIALSGVGPSQTGAASGLLDTTKQVGGALGLAALVAVAGTGAATPEALAVANGRAFAAIAAVLVLVAAAALTLPRRD